MTAGTTLKALLGPDERVRAFYLATASGPVRPDLRQAPRRQRAGHAGAAHRRREADRQRPATRRSDDQRRDRRGLPRGTQIFRIDHYLGKETVQNLMALRFANALFEPLWNTRHIDHVQITVAETLGVEGRGGYYDTAGALRDMVQNHMLQLLCLVAMEPPTSLDADAVRDEKLKVLKSLKPIDDANGGRALTVRGQYRAGVADGGPVPGYLRGDRRRRQPTPRPSWRCKAEIANWRWAGVPFYLRTGKRLPQRVSEIVVGFRPHAAFDLRRAPGRSRRTGWCIRLQPDEGIKLWLMIKDPGPGGMRLQHVPLDMSFAEAFAARSPDAYERLLMDVMRGNQTLFMRRDEVEAAWAWIDPILRGLGGSRASRRSPTPPAPGARPRRSR